MADQIRKSETIRGIERLQLSSTLILGLDDARKAESIADAIHSLELLGEHWN